MMSPKRSDRSEGAEDDGAPKRLRSRPVLYILTVLTVMVIAFLFSLRWDGIFACPANEYAGGDRYLAYCQARAYGDYDHGAFWFALEPEVRKFAASADVLFLGNSRMQFGFSAPALERWFAANGFRYYLLGFSHFENATFAGPLLQSLHPKARAFVINVDDFFVNQETLPGRDVMRGSDTRRRYISKRTGQAPHRLICTWLPAVCGDEISFYRQRETGEWRLDGPRGLEPSGIEFDLPVDAERVAREQVSAEKFIAGLGVDRRCVFLTYVPTKQNERATAAALAVALGIELISPQIEGLRTFDGSHLDRQSAERFVDFFLEIGGPRLRQCLSGEGTPAPRTDADRKTSPAMRVGP